jgi:hypothetical protein
MDGTVSNGTGPDTGRVMRAHAATSADNPGHSDTRTARYGIVGYEPEPEPEPTAYRVAWDRSLRLYYVTVEANGMQVGDADYARSRPEAEDMGRHALEDARTVWQEDMERYWT